MLPLKLLHLFWLKVTENTTIQSVSHEVERTVAQPITTGIVFLTLPIHSQVPDICLLRELCDELVLNKC